MYFAPSSGPQNSPGQLRVAQKTAQNSSKQPRTFQNSSECVPGGRLFEVSRQYSYSLRQVADLVEEPLEDQNLQMKVQSKRNFHAEIKPDKKINKTSDNIFDEPNSNNSSPDSSLLELEVNKNKDVQPEQNIRPEQVPFKDLESLFTK